MVRSKARLVLGIKIGLDFRNLMKIEEVEGEMIPSPSKVS